MKSPKELAQCFPYQFAEPHRGLSISRGWFDLFAQLCADIDELLGERQHGFHWTQVKEKFGSARFYWGFHKAEGIPDEATAQLLTQIAKLVDDATEKTKEACIACGQPGSPHKDAFYVLVLCQRHIEQREMDLEHMDPLWFSKEEDFLQ